MAKIDSNLITQIDNASGLIQAVVTLASEDASPAPSPERTEEIAKALLDRVTLKAGPPDKVNIMKYMGAFAIQASPEFIASLIEQPEVASAMANRR